MGIPIQCDHTIDSDVEKLFDRVRHEQEARSPRQQCLGGYEKDPQRDFDSPFWGSQPGAGMLCLLPAFVPITLPANTRLG